MGRTRGALSCAKIFAAIFPNLSRKIGMAFLGRDLALACSSLTDLRYCFIDGWETGFPIPSLSSHSPPNPASVKMARSFPIILSTVPAANRLGQEHEGVLSLELLGHCVWCTFVSPALSFQTRNFKMSPGVAKCNVFVWAKKPKQIKVRDEGQTSASGKAY